LSDNVISYIDMCRREEHLWDYRQRSLSDGRAQGTKTVDI